MAEAAAALGIAAAAVQFFDFSLKALTLCKQIRDSEKGATKVNQELEACIGKLKKVYEELNVGTRLQVADRPITKARQDCIVVVDELIKLLNDVKVNASDKSFATAKATFRVLKNKRAIEVLQHKLSQAQTRFMSAVSVDTKNDVALLLEGQNKLSDTIQKTLLPEIRKARAALAASHAKTHDQLLNVAATSSAAHGKTHDLLKVVQKNQELSLNVAKSTKVAISEGLTTIGVQTNVIAVNAETAARRKEVMDSLWYPEMFERQQSIQPPLFDSFEWIFDDSTAREDNIRAFEKREQPKERLREEMRGKFARWLRDDQPLFWISGKAGCGKSSLMSLIQSDPRTHQALSVWASGRQLYKFSFYFWRPGNILQKTVRGLVRSLLFQVAQANHAVADYLAATRLTDHSDWTTASLLAAFHKALSIFRDDRIFLLIDGLDEYEDDYDDLLNLLLEWRQEACFKVCVASRPETQILNGLSTYPFIRLQDLNRKDIELFVKGRLRPYEHRISNNIQEDLIARAEGVFLWVVLVSDDVKRGAAAGDDANTLWRRLKSLPTGLDTLFERLLGDIDTEHVEALKLCLFHLDDRFWPGVKSYNHCLLSWITASMPKCERIRTSEDFIEFCIDNSKDLIAQGKGLLELGSGEIPLKTSAWIFDTGKKTFAAVDKDIMKLCQRSIKFVHRSAHDFVFHPESTSSVHDRLRLTEEDVDMLVKWTLRGCETLIRLLPLSIFDFREVIMSLPIGSVDTMVVWGIESIVALSKETKHDHIVGEWLDRIYDMLPERFATQRKAPLSPAFRKAWCTKVNLSSTWHVEEDFWLGAMELDGYLESRWDRLVQHPHARAICSSIIVSSSSHTTAIDRCCNYLLAETQPESTVILIKHIREDRSHQGAWTMSWDANGGLDEEYVMATTGGCFRLTPLSRSEAPCDNVPFQAQGVFVGHFPRSEMPLCIQSRVNSGTRWRPSLPLQELYREGLSFRFLSYQDGGEVSRIPYTYWEVYNDLITGVCDVHAELLEEVLDLSSGPRDNTFSFPAFKGTQYQFSDCLEQVKKEIKANKKNQLSPAQKANMLELVERHFQEFWTIATPETLELSRITLENCPKHWQKIGLLGDLR